MALDFLSESPSDAAEASAMKAETIAPNPEPAAPPSPAPAPAPAAAPAAPEPPKAAEPAPAPKVEPAPVKKDGAPVGYVPNAALREARETIQARDRRIAELEGRGQQPTPEPAKEIDPETDPIAALKEVREWQQTQRDLQKQQTQIREFSTRVQAHEADWAAANPEYAEQVKFLHDFRASQLEALGFTREQIGAQLQQEALQTADIAFRNNKNPGEVFSTLAIKSGWKAKAAASAPTPAPAAPAPDVEQKRAESEAALERISRGQKASRATAGGGGNEPAEDMTVERLASLNGAAFDAAMEKHGKRLFGG